MVAALDDTGVASPGLSLEVLGAGIAFVASASATGLELASPQDPPSGLLLFGWPFLAVVGAVVVDRQPGSRLGRMLCVLSLGSVVMVLWTLVRYDGLVPAPELARGSGELSALLAGALVLGIPLAIQAPHNHRASVLLCAQVGLGAVAVLGARAAALPHWVQLPGWVAVAVGTLGTWALVARAARTAGRDVRRRVGAVLVTLGVAASVVALAWALGPGDAGYYATGGALVVVALAVDGLWLGTELRPLDEHLLDLGLVAGTVASAAAAGALVQLGSHLAGQESARTTTVFTALLTVTMATPAALWVRRAVLVRRYGSGVLAPEDVARITAGLHAKTQPRDLLDQAARMVAAASGCRDARIVLGDEEPAVPAGWLMHALVVGGDQVGALLIEPESPEGPEARQQRVIAQLLSTVSLVARAVGLAIEAEHARRDVARERESERRRVLGDLHDGLGPALAGMSMRVQAALRTSTSPEQTALLTDLAAGLAAGRTDLRRIVAGITPSHLDDGDLEGALAGLVESFRGSTDVPQVGLRLDLAEADLSPDVQVAVYRTAAEGITNALRHAGAATIEVSVRASAGRVAVDVADDGTGGAVVAGVGLSSLTRRAESLGGSLRVCSGHEAGTTLHLDLPAAAKEPT